MAVFSTSKSSKTSLITLWPSRPGLCIAIAFMIKSSYYSKLQCVSSPIRQPLITYYKHQSSFCQEFFLNIGKLFSCNGHKRTTFTLDKESTINSHIHHPNLVEHTHEVALSIHHHSKLHREVLATQWAGVVELSPKILVNTRRNRCDRFPYTLL